MTLPELPSACRSVYWLTMLAGKDICLLHHDHSSNAKQKRERISILVMAASSRQQCSQNPHVGGKPPQQTTVLKLLGIAQFNFASFPPSPHRGSHLLPPFVASAEGKPTISPSFIKRSYVFLKDF